MRLFMLTLCCTCIWSASSSLPQDQQAKENALNGNLPYILPASSLHPPGIANDKTLLVIPEDVEKEKNKKNSVKTKEKENEKEGNEKEENPAILELLGDSWHYANAVTQKARAIKYYGKIAPPGEYLVIFWEEKKCQLANKFFKDNFLLTQETVEYIVKGGKGLSKYLPQGVKDEEINKYLDLGLKHYEWFRIKAEKGADGNGHFEFCLKKTQSDNCVKNTKEMDKRFLKLHFCSLFEQHFELNPNARLSIMSTDYHHNHEDEAKQQTFWFNSKMCAEYKGEAIIFGHKKKEEPNVDGTHVAQPKSQQHSQGSMRQGMGYYNNSNTAPPRKSANPHYPTQEWVKGSRHLRHLVKGFGNGTVGENFWIILGKESH